MIVGGQSTTGDVDDKLLIYQSIYIVANLQAQLTKLTAKVAKLKDQRQQSKS